MNTKNNKSSITLVLQTVMYMYNHTICATSIFAPVKKNLGELKLTNVAIT